MSVLTKTAHWANTRSVRDEVIQYIGAGEPYATFIWDRGHKDGLEKHVLTTTGLIYIYNLRSGRLITVLIARPGQVKRYYPNGDWPWFLVNIAKRHQRAGWNIV